MKIYIKTCFLLFSLFFTGCSDSKIGLFVKSFIFPISHETIHLEDQTTSLYYTIKKGKDPKTLLFFISGSGYTSLQYFLGNYFDELNADVEIFALQKRTVSNRTTGMFGKPDRFDTENIFDHWVKDNLFFIRKILSEKRESDKKVILFGVSEGATVAAKLTTLIPEVTHLVVLGSGGYEQSEELKRSFAGYEIDFEEVYEEIRKNPEDVNREFLGNPFKYWSHILFVNPMMFYSEISIPILLGIGDKDESVPVESARFLKHEFERLGKPNLKYIEFFDCNHVLTDLNQKSHRKEFFDEMITWSNMSS